MIRLANLFMLRFNFVTTRIEIDGINVEKLAHIVQGFRPKHFFGLKFAEGKDICNSSRGIAYFIFNVIVNAMGVGINVRDNVAIFEGFFGLFGRGCA